MFLVDLLAGVAGFFGDFLAMITAFFFFGGASLNSSEDESESDESEEELSFLLLAIFDFGVGFAAVF